jgi:hypothetical protein
VGGSARAPHEERRTSTKKERVSSISLRVKRAGIEFWSVFFSLNNPWNASTMLFSEIGKPTPETPPPGSVAPRTVLALADLLVHQPGQRSIDATLLERHAKSGQAHLDPAKSAA